MAKIPEPIASFRTTITNKITSSAATILIDSVTDDDGNSMNGKILGMVIDKGLETEEYILGTVDSASSSLTSVTRGLSVTDGATSVAGNKFAHRKKAPIEISDHPYLTLIARILNGTDGIDPSYRPKLSSDVNTTDDKQFVTAAQLNRAAMGGVTSSRVLAEGTAGETIAAGNLVYFKAADGRWWLCDADTAATVENIILGLAQGAGTAGNAITGGVLLWGIDSNQSGRTIGAVQYAGNTAGALSESAGTTEVTVAQAKSATEVYFYPRYNQQLTEDQQDALGGTSGTPSNTNKFVTQADENRNTGVIHYGASSAGSDAYAITPSQAITAYAAGQMFAVKADVGNTGACTLQVSGLAGPKNIKMSDGSDPFTGYIAAGSIFIVRYDGTNMMLMTPPSNLVSGITTPITVAHAHKRTRVRTTKAGADATVATTYAHGLGVTPNYVTGFALLGASNGGNPMQESIGYYDRPTGAQSTIYQDGTNAPSGNDSAFLTIVTPGGGDQVGVITAIDATNVTITWTKSSAGFTGTAQILLVFEI